MVGGRPRHGDAPRVVRHLPRLPGRPPTHLPATHLRRHRLPGAMQSSWTVPSRILVRSRVRSRCGCSAVEPTAVAVHDVRAVTRQGRTGPRGRWRSRRVARRSGRPRAGGEILVLEVDAHRRSVNRRARLRRARPTTDDVAGHLEAWTEGAGVPLAFEVSVHNPDWTRRSMPSLCAAGSSSSPSTSGPPVACSAVLRELTVIGARVYEVPLRRAVDLVAAGVAPPTP